MVEQPIPGWPPENMFDSPNSIIKVLPVNESFLFEGTLINTAGSIGNAINR